LIYDTTRYNTTRESLTWTVNDDVVSKVIGLMCFALLLIMSRISDKSDKFLLRYYSILFTKMNLEILTVLADRTNGRAYLIS